MGEPNPMCPCGQVLLGLTAETKCPDCLRMPPEVQRVFEDFWADIVCPGGEWDLDQVKKELHDCWVFITEVPKVYMELTLGAISKPHTSAAAVLAVHEETCQNGGAALEERVELLEEMLREANDAFDEATGDYPKGLVHEEPWRAFRSGVRT